ncbi:MAG: hypothetical protein QOG95_4809 [Mycobacterium sp.]|jgi:hypothetical protein|nr:hypothetical protein [Mycobacterium sp.]
MGLPARPSRGRACRGARHQDVGLAECQCVEAAHIVDLISAWTAQAVPKVAAIEVTPRSSESLFGNRLGLPDVA